MWKKALSCFCLRVCVYLGEPGPGSDKKGGKCQTVSDLLIQVLCYAWKCLERNYYRYLIVNERKWLCIPSECKSENLGVSQCCDVASKMALIITTRNEVGARLYFHRRLWFCSQGDLDQAGTPLGCARFAEILSELTKTWSSGATECRVWIDNCNVKVWKSTEHKLHNIWRSVKFRQNEHTPGTRHPPPRTRQAPLRTRQVTPPGAEHTGRYGQRVVCILLECNLVLLRFSFETKRLAPKMCCNPY